MMKKLTKNYIFSKEIITFVTIILIFIIFFLTARFSFAQIDDETTPKNFISVDFGPLITSFTIINISSQYEKNNTAFGFGVNYERLLTTAFSIGGDIKYTFMNFPLYDAGFNSLNITIHGRYYLFSLPKGLFFDYNLGGLWHHSPYQSNFMLSIGSALGYRFNIKSRFFAEVYIGWAVYSGDKYLAPWSLMSLSELIIPGLYISLPLGFSF
ncbi:MAG: hypothetical protein FWD47_02770 [Treponema sp.]|nr:hypothetical protein [Treponema sp.]